MRFDSELNMILISARELADRTSQSGNLGGGGESPTSEEGRILHKALASMQGDGFRAEVPISADFVSGNITYRISGRADGVTEGDVPIVTEFKTVTHSAFERASSRLGRAQVMIYAACLALSRGFPKVTARLVIATPDGENVKNSDRVYTSEELELALHAFIAKVASRARNEVDAARQVHPALSKLKFPHPSLREGQRELISSVASAVGSGKRLFAQAPTGIGKTVSVLYGAARAMGRTDIRRVFYLTAKASTRREAYAAAGRLASVGAGLRTMVLTAKEQICPRRTGGDFICDPEHCPLAKGYYDRRDAAIESLILSYKGYPSGAISQAAAKHNICPYELSLDLSEYCDVIICDYNYAFDPAVKLRRYFGDSAYCGGKNVFLIDEAHNLPERARDIFSATLTREDVRRITEAIRNDTMLTSALASLDEALCRAGELCEENMSEYEGVRCGYYFNRDPLPDLDDAVSRALERADLFYFTHRTDIPLACAAARFRSVCKKWQNAAENFDERYRTYIEKIGEEVSLKLYCLDPSARLDDALGEAYASVFFSATLTPADYFSDILGGGRDSCSISLPSPFPRENLGLIALTNVSTRFEDRDRSYKRIAGAIAATVAAKRGNYIVYFPSYKYMQSVTDIFTARYPNVPVAIQRSGMTRQEREEFLSFFENDVGCLRVGFCVLGGSFSEGVDLPGSRLIGTLIVGVGLPGLSAERNIIRDYFENRAECGYDYSYTYPGMNSVLQAAGRVIRRPDDRGVVVLIDDRYAEEKYRALYPPHWSEMKFASDIPELQGILGDFWAKFVSE
ncbi:MAG: ATP-dependent DNA helicase [Clostridia bacterium]|nr:ATP-dependent DNA helicase [Clostridia bacterium]